MAAVGDKDIGGLDIPVVDPFPVSGIEPVGDLDGEVQDPVEGKGPAGDFVLERPAVEVLHRNEVPSLEFVDIMDGADVRAIERR